MVKLELEVTPQFYDFLQAINETGLYGPTVEDTFLRMAERQAERLWESGAMIPPAETRAGFKKEKNRGKGKA